MVAALARTEAQVGCLIFLLLISLSALGGSFIPHFVIPRWLRMVGLITPHARALDAYQDLLVRGYNLGEVLPKIGVLGAFAVIFFGTGSVCGGSALNEYSLPAYLYSDTWWLRTKYCKGLPG